MFTGGANVIAVLILLAEFGMLRQALLRDHIRLYMAQSALIAVLAVIVAAARHIPDLYVLAALTVALKVIVIPLLLRRLLRETGPVGAPGRRRRYRWQRRPRRGQHRAAGHRGRGVRVLRRQQARHPQ